MTFGGSFAANGSVSLATLGVALRYPSGPYTTQRALIRLMAHKDGSTPQAQFSLSELRGKSFTADATYVAGAVGVIGFKGYSVGLCGSRAVVGPDIPPYFVTEIGNNNTISDIVMKGTVSAPPSTLFHTIAIVALDYSSAQFATSSTASITHPTALETGWSWNGGLGITNGTPFQLFIFY